MEYRGMKKYFYSFILVLCFVVIGNNKDESKAGNVMLTPASMGFSFTEALTISNIWVSSGRKYVSSYIAEGEDFYIDRDVKIKEIPSAYQGMLWVETANDDKMSVSPSEYLRYEINQDATVYVGYDTRLSVPGWLSGWSNTEDVIKSDDQEGKNSYRLYRKDFAGGSVTLGPNAASQSSSNMYIVLNAPQGDHFVDWTPPEPPTGLRVLRY